MENRQKNFQPLKVALGLVAVLTFMIVPPSSATEYPGPDEFGYVAYEIDNNLRDISSEETIISLGDDQVSGAIQLPFTFSFYGFEYNKVFISSNGFITFDENEETGYFGGESIPNSLNPNNMIAGFWEDFDPSGGGVSYGSVSTDGNLQFVVAFNAVPHFGTGIPVTFQIILHEGSNDIELQYGSAYSDGGTHTVGIENADGTTGLQIAYGNISFDREGFIITKSRIFESFEVQKAIVSFGRGSALDRYDLEGEFTLPGSNDGTINPVDEDVLITVGSANLVIPAGSFKEKRRKQGVDFLGWVEGALVHASLEEVGPHTFRYKFDVREIDLTDSPVPINFNLRVGTSLGLTTIPLYGELSSGRRHNYYAPKTGLSDLQGNRSYNRRHYR